jgi:hypothetical protein
MNAPPVIFYLLVALSLAEQATRQTSLQAPTKQLHAFQLDMHASESALCQENAPAPKSLEQQRGAEMREAPESELAPEPARPSWQLWALAAAAGLIAGALIRLFRRAGR